MCLCLQSEWFIWVLTSPPLQPYKHISDKFVWGLPSSTASILQYTNVTGPNQSGSSWDRPPATPLLALPAAAYSFGYRTGIPRVL